MWANHTQSYFMKKLFLALIAAASVSSVSAQCGSILLYGDLSYNKVSTVSNAMYAINPGVGYQLNKNWTAGIALNYGQDTAQTANLGLGLFARYSHDMGDVFYCYGQVDVAYNKVSNNGNDISTGFGVMLTPAVGIKVGHGYAVNFNMGGLGYMSSTPTGGTASNTLNFTFGQAVRVGLSKNFGCCHKSCKKGKEEAGNDEDAPKKGKKAAKKDKDDE